MKNKKTLLETPSEEPVLLRGTSVEKVIDMLSTGRLVSRTEGNSERPADNGYMFFIPNKRAFEGHDFYDEIDIDYDVPGLEREAGYCARVSQQIEFLKQVFGDWPAKYHVEELEAMEFEKLMKAGVNIYKIDEYGGLGKLLSDAKGKKGVVIGINRKIFELDIEQGCDEPGQEAMIYVPNGLDIKYVLYVKPMGSEEKAKLDEFIRG